MGRGPGSPPSSLLAFRARALGHSSFVRLPVVWELVQQGVGPAMVPGGGGVVAHVPVLRWPILKLPLCVLPGVSRPCW